jgi:ferredoxin-NADP reductase/MOSC domain-containing protein YiiM
MARLLSVNVGLPRDIGWHGKTVHTGIWKEPVAGRRMVRRLNIDGDGQGDLAGHGGENRAVYVYQIESYRFWQGELGRDDFVCGQFGENFTIDGLPDAEACIGDRYRIGDALFEITQPRVTCYRLGIRMNEPQMAALLVKHGRPGFYFRVLEEGEVEAGNTIVKIASGSERMTVSEINSLLYMPGHPREKLERAARISALSVGWRHSFEALLEQQSAGTGGTGNAGLTEGPGTPPAWQGLLSFRVSRKVKESVDVVSVELERVDGKPLTAAEAGQYIVLRIEPKTGSPLLRSYSLSGAPGDRSYRISVKREALGAASGYINDRLQVGDIVQASAPRGAFTLRPGDTPVVLLSAGIGVTPVLAMLHALAAEASGREIWWLHGARSGRERVFAAETGRLVERLAHCHSFVCYSAPDPEDQPDIDFNASGHLDGKVVGGLNIPDHADYYICGPSRFMDELTVALKASGIGRDRTHTEIFGAAPPITPGVAASPRPAPHLPVGSQDTGALVSFTRSGLNVRWEPRFSSLLELAEACDVPVRWSCRTGVCHTCETALITGKVSYQPNPIDDPSEGNVLICCSRPDGDIAVDL